MKHPGAHRTNLEHAIEDARLCPETEDPRVLEAAKLSLEGDSWKEIAGKLGVDEKTLYRWRVRYELDAYVAQLSRQRFEQFLRQQAAMAIDANAVIKRALAGAKGIIGTPEQDPLVPLQIDVAKHVAKNVQQMAILALKLQGNDGAGNGNTATTPRSVNALPVEALEAIVASGDADAIDAPCDEGDP